MEINVNNKERGAVALITAMIVSILLLITTSGMVALTLKSLKGSTDGAQSTKAYYAAEGGLEETLLKLKNDRSYRGDCQGSSNTTQSATDGVVTCIKVTPAPNQIQGTLNSADDSVQIDLSGVAGVSTIAVEWGPPTGITYNPVSIPKYIDPSGASNFPAKGSNWPSSAPAVLEAAAVEFPSDPEFSISQVNFYQATLAPKSIRTSDPSYSIKQSNGTATSSIANFYKYNDGNVLNKPFVVACRESAPYQCKASAYGISGSNRYMLRLKSRYNGAAYRISVYDANNAPLAIPGSMYVVDVTARAGDTFRRIQTSFPVDQPSPTGLKGLDYVLYSDTDICKSFEVKGSGVTGLGCTAPF